MKNDDQYVDEDAPTDVFTRPRSVSVPPPRQMVHEQLWDANDVARYLKVSRSWVYHRAEAGSLPLRRVGGLLRFEPAAIRAFATGESPTPDVGAGQRERWTDGPGARRTRR
jgi:excisionase family DNA binding protein